MASTGAVGVIPARHASTRFPGKPLAPIAGRPMIQHVAERVLDAERLDRVLVATDDERIAEVCADCGIEAVMTSSSHPTGTDRLAEVAANLTEEIIVNIQGDEPLIEGFVIDAAVAALDEFPETPMSTVVHAAEAGALADPNRVKVVMDRSGHALYFSRSSIPHARDGAEAPVFQHVGLYAYRRPFLLELQRLPQTELERCEALEQLRVLEHGHRIRCAVVEGWTSIPVDVPADVAAVEAALTGGGQAEPGA